MEQDGNQKKLNKLEGKLYSRNAPSIIDKGRSDLIKNEDEIPHNWEDVKKGGFDELAARVSRVAESKHHFVKKFFVISIVFFLISAAVAAFVFLGGVNLVSSKNVDIKVVGPLSIGSGQETAFDINIINTNNIDLGSVSLLVEYPLGTRSSVDITKELNRERFSIGDIKSGQSFTQNISGVFFGEKESVKQIKLSLEYKVENSSALFYKEKIYEIAISSSPIIVTPVYPKEVNSNQEILFNIELASNSEESLNNFLVNVEYPFGFVYRDASPAPSFGNNSWKFDSLKSNEKKTISIRGNVVGQDNEERVFRINTGTASVDDERKIGVPISSLTESILVKKPFIELSTSIGGKSGDSYGRGGSLINAEFTIQNNLPSKLFNTRVETSFSGGAFNASSVVAQNEGFFQSFNNTILWDKRSVPELSEMSPGAEEKLSFRLVPLSYSSIPSGSKPEIEVTFKVTGERVLESGSVEEVSATEVRKIILTTDFTLTGRVSRSEGGISSYGPIPPKVNTPTSYNILWSISNSFNQVSNAEIRATLPSYVKWTGKQNPSGENLKYIEETNELVWNAGTILANTGFGSNKKEISFQLELLPSLSQRDIAPSILGEATLSGIDKITGIKLESTYNPLTTYFFGDPTFKSNDDKVVQ